MNIGYDLPEILSRRKKGLNSKRSLLQRNLPATFHRTPLRSLLLHSPPISSPRGHTSGLILLRQAGEVLDLLLRCIQKKEESMSNMTRILLASSIRLPSLMRADYTLIFCETPLVVRIEAVVAVLLILGKRHQQHPFVLEKEINSNINDCPIPF